ncbi:MAG: S41 family peptidase [Tenacibaculum sp.]
MNNKKILLVAGLFTLAVLFSFQSRFFEIAKQIEIYNNLFKELNINYIDEINPGNLTDRVIKSTLKNLDPYTNFYNEQDVEDVRIRREGEYGGIGVLTHYSKQGIVLSEVYKDFPADKAGFKPGDIIIGVNGQSLKGLANSELSQILKGIPGKEIYLEVQRGNQKINSAIKLDKIVVNPVPFFDMINDEIGYVVLTRFTSKKASEELTKAVEILKNKGMKKLIFDLRSNPGGSLLDAVNITNLFIPKGEIVVDTRGKINSNSQIYKTNKEPFDTQIPLVVLIDNRSASASEIVAGALQDYDRAIVLGKRSFGKGLVQRYFNLSYGTQVKITISKYYTPSGRCIQELDYANRDFNTGKVPKFSDKEVLKFTTKNGRSVYDGGGIVPDVEAKQTDSNSTTKELLKSKAIFNFAYQYSSKIKTLDSLNFKFSDTDFSEFKNFLLTDTSFVSKDENTLKKAFGLLKNKQAVKDEYEKLALKLNLEKIKKISENKDLIAAAIEREIIKAAFYKQGMYRHQLKNDNIIKQAVNLLNNSLTYKTILNK